MDRREFIGGMGLAVAGLAAGAARAADGHELVLRDVRALIDGGFNRCDIGVSAGRIAAIAEPGTLSGAEVIAGQGLYVSPGWVDLHVHYVDWRHRKSAGSSVKRLGTAQGVTALLDAGTTGPYNYDRLETAVADSLGEVPCLALLNIKREGIKLSNFYMTRIGWDDIPAMGPVIEKSQGRIIGLKLRADSEVSARSDRLYYVRKIREAGDLLKMPITIHIGAPPPSLEDILPYMKEGDTICHFLRGKGNCIIGPDGKLTDAVKDAYARGVKWDVAHGMSSFAFDAVLRALDQGFDDFTVSSDIYIASGILHARTFANVLTNLLAAGMPLAAIIERASTKPAKVMGLEREIRPGAEATLTVFSLAEGQFTCKDVTGQKRVSEKRIIPEWTVMKGRKLRAGDLDRRLFL
ncbi:MAG TPA: hypothetical protein VM658_09055 [bacterium]|nr:hypothetical protein [bacterium]